MVSAGGTATVSGLGTISAISIGNSGSGYRAGVQTVNVGVALSSTSAPSIEFIGTATISNGNIVSVAITNPGTGYTTTNVPYVIFDDPLSYSGIALTYSSVSSGIGSGATIDIVVGQGSSIIDFEIRNTGYGFKSGEKLTVPIGGLTGIPTTSTYRESLIDVQKVFTDEFTAWSLELCKCSIILTISLTEALLHSHSEILDHLSRLEQRKVLILMYRMFSLCLLMIHSSSW